jgi:hypothetical protein
MRVLSAESYSVAWFKLADFVARGEKERALNVHKLLMHAVDEEAFAYQLEADILLSFDDELALGKYHVAANLYKKQEKYQRAIDVYRHVLLRCEDLSMVESLLDVYNLLENDEELIKSFSLFSKACLKQQDVGLLFNRLHSFSIYPQKTVYARLHAALVESFLLYDPQNKHLKMYLEQTVDLLKECKDKKLFNSFVERVKELDESVYVETKKLFAKKI